MRSLVILVAALCMVSCKDTSTDNLVDFTFRGSTHSWGSNDGSCQFRNQSSVMYCYLDIGSNPDEDDLSFSLGVETTEQIEEGTYEDVRETAYPNVAISLWVEGDGGELEHCETPTASNDPLSLSINRLDGSTVRGEFEGDLVCDGAGEAEAISASYFMTLSQ